MAGGLAEILTREKNTSAEFLSRDIFFNWLTLLTRERLNVRQLYYWDFTWWLDLTKIRIMFEKLLCLTVNDNYWAFTWWLDLTKIRRLFENSCA